MAVSTKAEQCQGLYSPGPGIEAAVGHRGPADTCQAPNHSERQHLSGVILDAHSQENWNQIQGSCAGKNNCDCGKTALAASTADSRLQIWICCAQTPSAGIARLRK